MDETTANNTDRFYTTKALIIAGWVLLLFVALIILGANIYTMLAGSPIPDLINWGSMVLGFLFGSFVTIVQNFMGGSKTP